MKNMYFVLVQRANVEQLITLEAYITNRPAYKNRYMAHVLDVINDEIIFYESHPNLNVLKDNLEACIEKYGYIIFSYNEYSFPGFYWYD